MKRPGERFREAVEAHAPLPVVGTVHAYAALMAERIGHKAIYLSGGGVANASHGLPDLGVTTMHDVLEDARRITSASELPLLIDIDTGFGGAFSIARTVKEAIKAEVAGVHIEDQVLQKRCGHRPNKAIVPLEEMVNRVKAAVDAKTDDSFVIMARTDALAVEGMDAAIERAVACAEAGADMVFPEAIETLEQYGRFAEAAKIPVMANLTEFGKTPLFNRAELAEVGVKLMLYPLSAFRAMNRAAERVYRSILDEGDQRAVVENMQTREELYDYLDYEAYERKLDELFAEEEPAWQG